MLITRPLFAIAFAALLLGSTASSGKINEAPSGSSKSQLWSDLEATTPKLQRQRALYLRAQAALSEGKIDDFTKLGAELKDYPLYPYLLFAHHSREVSHVGAESIHAFLKIHSDSPLAGQLRLHWLRHLKSEERWRQFLDIFDPQIADIELQCTRALAYLHSGNKGKGVTLGLRLWTQGHSLPQNCDPLFQRLIDGGHIDEDSAWRRYLLALSNHRYNLAHYALGFIHSPDKKTLAKSYLQVHQNPELLGEYHRFAQPAAEQSGFVAHAIRDLSIDNPMAALKHWRHYRQALQLEAEGELVAALAKSLFSAGQSQAGTQLLIEAIDSAPLSILEWRLRALVKDRDWQEVIRWIDTVPATVRQQSRWSYWRARALELSGEDRGDEIDKLYRQLAKERSFYGFLASEKLNTPYQMQHQPIVVEAEALYKLASLPPFQRVRELLYHQDFTAAQREWRHALKGREASHWLVAAKLATLWDWPSQAIHSMIEAAYWHDIDIRFPRPFMDQFMLRGRTSDIPVHLLLALSRQESAFNPQVTSPAGAMGLMQLMPSTARETARRLKVPYRGPATLYDPNNNIHLGTSYYRLMLDRFGNNRILATAAYNAGPRRVDHWLRDTAGEQSFDAWIETIPFTETRNYVQSVLAFSIIYAHHLGLDKTMLSTEEQNRLL